MSREVDCRNTVWKPLTTRLENEFRSYALEVSEQLPGEHEVYPTAFNSATGNPSVLVSISAPSDSEQYIQRALNHVQAISKAMGLSPSQPVEFVPDPNIQQTSSHAIAVHLQQQYKGIPIFQAAITVRFAPTGALTETAGNTVSIVQETNFTLQLSAPEAVLKAAQHIATPGADEEETEDHLGQPLAPASADITGFQPKVIATFSNIPQQPTVLEAGCFGDEILANLTWFMVGDFPKLTWETLITLPNFAGQYRTIVDAQTGEILYCCEVMHAVAVRGKVYRTNPNSLRQMTDFPRTLSDYGIIIPSSLPSSFPGTWVTSNRMEGNHTSVVFNPPTLPLQGLIQQGALTFDPNDAFGDEQKLLNAFYFNCFMHDYFYLLGFREADGNFQVENFGQGGIASDCVEVQLFNTPINGTARMLTPVDGLAPIMQLGVEASTLRHTAFDGSVIFHEFTHGVTNRLVGGLMNDRALEAPQSRGMAEGWSDYFACTITNQNVLGSWLVNRTGGIRTAPYDTNYPGNFGNLGNGIYTKPHTIGEIWCATLMEMNCRIGQIFAVQLVMDALKLSPANPSFLDMRDAIFAALNNKLSASQISSNDYVMAKDGIWGAFGKFGMGPNAQCVGATLLGIVPDFKSTQTTPPTIAKPRIKLSETPNLKIPDNQRTGISHTLTVQQVGQIAYLAITIEIQHPYPADLQVILTTPQSQVILLYNRTWSSSTSLSRIFTTRDRELTALIGTPANGTWTLNVADVAAIETGVLQKWMIEIELA